ncbi:MAG TPA: FAD-binding oxidoreductase [Candidatus Dependentiae bacterium]|nr:FAD-binding oxidoreductase [Candidatus Dependentiae bacterium]HRQ62885.1 FAD-binding oxidoreductase [Candidatus Dependentiae bacterium]
MKKQWPPQDQVFWYLYDKPTSTCRENITTDVAIIGGGMAGLSAAHAFQKRGKKVILLEQYYCGAGASGKSSGFITPNAELSFTDFAKKYSKDSAHHIWDFITSGSEDIRTNILQHKFACDYVEQNTLIAANHHHNLKTLQIECDNLAAYGYKTAMYSKDALQKYINSANYVGGMEYAGSFGINSYLYCQAMKQLLQQLGVDIYEQTPVTRIDNHTIHTMHARIQAKHIIVCTDRFTPQLGLLENKVYHVQTFLMVSQVLTNTEIAQLFPENNYLVWDTDLIYTYFRITADKRLLLGGGNLWTTFATQEKHNYHPIIQQLTRYFNKKFPDVHIQFEHIWPGLIGISKDIVPIAGPDQKNPHIYYITASAGLPIAAALGRYSAEHIIDGRTDLDQFFSPYRKFLIHGPVQSLLGTRLSFALSTFISSRL